MKKKIKKFEQGYVMTVKVMAEKFKVKNPKNKFQLDFNNAIDKIIKKMFGD